MPKNFKEKAANLFYTERCYQIIEIIKSRLDDRGISVLSFAKMHGFSQPYLHKIFSHTISSEKISFLTILKLLKAVGLDLELEYVCTVPEIKNVSNKISL